MKNVTAFGHLSHYHVLGERIEADGAYLALEQAFLFLIERYRRQSPDLSLRHSSFADPSIQQVLQVLLVDL